MAKKQSLKIKSGHTCAVTSSGPGEFTLTVAGRNSRGTSVTVSAIFSDWNIPGIAKDLIGITKQRVDSAIHLRGRLKTIMSEQ